MYRTNANFKRCQWGSIWEQWALSRGGWVGECYIAAWLLVHYTGWQPSSSTAQPLCFLSLNMMSPIRYLASAHWHTEPLVPMLVFFWGKGSLLGWKAVEAYFGIFFEFFWNISRCRKHHCMYTGRFRSNWNMRSGCKQGIIKTCCENASTHLSRQRGTVEPWVRGGGGSYRKALPKRWKLMENLREIEVCWGKKELKRKPRRKKRHLGKAGFSPVLDFNWDSFAFQNYSKSSVH